MTKALHRLAATTTTTTTKAPHRLTTTTTTALVLCLFLVHCQVLVQSPLLARLLARLPGPNPPPNTDQPPNDPLCTRDGISCQPPPGPDPNPPSEEPPEDPEDDNDDDDDDDDDEENEQCEARTLAPQPEFEVDQEVLDEVLANQPEDGGDGGDGGEGGEGEDGGEGHTPTPCKDEGECPECGVLGTAHCEKKEGADE